MDFSSERSGESTYLKVDLGEWQSLDAVGYEMLSNNDIEGLIKPIFDQFDSEIHLRYDVTRYQSLADVLQYEMSRAQVVGIFRSIVETYDLTKDYLLCATSLVLDEQHVYVSSEKDSARLVYIPIEGWESGVALETFFRRVISMVHDSRDASYIGQILSFLNGGSFTLDSFKRLLVSVEAGGGRPASNNAGGGGNRGAQGQPAPQRAAQQRGGVPRPQPQQQPRPQPQPQPQRPVQQGGFSAPVPGAAQVAPPSAGVGYAIPGQEGAASGGASQESSGGLFGMFKKSDKTKDKKGGKKGAKGGDADKDKGGLFGGLFGGKDDKPAAAGAGGFGFDAPGIGDSPEVVMARRAQQDAQQGSSASSARNATAIDADFGETVYGGADAQLNASGSGTAVGSAARPNILRDADGSLHAVSKSPFVLGRTRADADLAIEDNREISKRHAQITFDGSSYWIEDLGSLNHTYLDGKTLQPGQRERLSDGMTIRLSGERLIFTLG